MQHQTKLRLDYLDAARSIALILGIIFHASISFMPIFIGWAVMDISTNMFVPKFMLVSHSFRMALFFLIAGFFSHMSFHQQGARQGDLPRTWGFIKSRLLRIGIPLLIGWFLLRPLLVSGWVMGAQSMRGEVDILSSLSQGLADLSQLPTGLLVGTHLWFLYYLLLLCAGVLLGRYLIGLYQPINRQLSLSADKFIVWLCHSPLAIFALAIPTAACLWFMQHWGIDTPDKSLVPLVPVALLYGGFFLFGWLLQRQAFLLERFARLSWRRLVLSIESIILTVLLSDVEMKLGHAHYLWLKSGFMLNYAIMMWTLVMLTIGLCKRLFNRPSQLVRYIADSSYWLYLSHLPLVIWLQVAFAELPIYWLVKLIGISVITIVFSLLLYDVFIRATFCGALLNGKRKTRYLFDFNNRQ